LGSSFSGHLDFEVTYVLVLALEPSMGLDMIDGVVAPTLRSR
jgi:hypothetical protein